MVRHQSGCVCEEWSLRWCLHHPEGLLADGDLNKAYQGTKQTVVIWRHFYNRSEKETLGKVGPIDLCRL